MNIHSLQNSPKTSQLDEVFKPQTSSKKPHSAHPNQAQEITDSMEEISMKFSESVEQQTKSLEERSVRPKMVHRIEKLRELYSLLTGEHDHQHLNDEVRKLMALAQQKVALKDLMSLAEDDPATAEIMLQHASHRVRHQQDRTVLEHLQQVADELHESHGREVAAGINTAKSLALFSQDPMQRKNIRQVYYQAIVGKGSLSAIFDALLSQFDERYFTRGIHTLMRALNDDLSSHFPSLPNGHLRTLLRDLTASQKLSQILNACGTLLQRLSRKGLVKSMNPTTLTRRLIDFTQSNVYPREVKKLCEECVGTSPLDHAPFLNALYPMIQDIPLALWKDNKSQQNVLNLFLRMMTEYASYERNVMSLSPESPHEQVLSTSNDTQKPQS